MAWCRCRSKEIDVASLPSSLAASKRRQVNRITDRLTPDECEAFRRLIQTRESAWKFWEQVAARRGFDPATILAVDGQPHAFSGLPNGHGKHWCWPAPLHCIKPPAAFSYVQH
jgi:hypothetical protein